QAPRGHIPRLARPSPYRAGRLRREGAQVASDQSIRVAIVGAGRGGTALIELFTRCNGIEITGVADVNPDAPGLHLARRLNILATTDPAALVAGNGTHLIVDVTGDPAMASLVATHKSPRAESLGGTAARLLWSLIQEEHELYEHLVHAEKLSTLGTFAAGIAHEFNNPLHCVLGFAQLIQDTNDPALIREYVQEIVKSVRHLSGMTTNLNMYARTGTRGEAARVQLAEVLDEAVKMAKFSTILDEVTVVRDYAPAAAILANPDELHQVFVNLIVNAVQAMNARGRLTLSIAAEPSALVVSIHDTGPGIAPQDLAKVFAPFFTTKDRRKGTGLGLYIVQTIV
ncbi:MAG: ATP-binding protein, partial [Nitrospiraceae bacterium]